MQTGMWNGQPCILYDKTIVKEDVDVDASRPFWNGAFSSKVLLDFEAVSQQVCRLQRSLRRYHLVQKPILILEIHRLGGHRKAFGLRAYHGVARRGEIGGFRVDGTRSCGTELIADDA